MLDRSIECHPGGKEKPVGNRPPGGSYDMDLFLFCFLSWMTEAVLRKRKGEKKIIRRHGMNFNS